MDRLLVLAALLVIVLAMSETPAIAPRWLRAVMALTASLGLLAITLRFCFPS